VCRIVNNITEKRDVFPNITTRDPAGLVFVDNEMDYFEKVARNDP